MATLCVVVGVDEGTDLRGGIGLVDEATVLVQWYKGSVPPVLLDWCPKLAGKMSLLAPMPLSNNGDFINTGRSG